MSRYNEDIFESEEDYMDAKEDAMLDRAEVRREQLMEEVEFSNHVDNQLSLFHCQKEESGMVRCSSQCFTCRSVESIRLESTERSSG